jgi:hypothetical protein
MVHDDNVMSAIDVLFGSEGVKYIERKHRGGSSGAKGTHYEDVFLAIKVAEAAANIVDGTSREWPYITGQYCCFVDDVRISLRTKTEYFQLKNLTTVPSWTSGEHPIAEDFYKQYQLSMKLEEPNPATILVVPEVTFVDRLGQNMPVHIRDFSSVCHFPSFSSPDLLVWEVDWVRDMLRKLSVDENATIDQLFGLLGALLMACRASQHGDSACDIVDHVARMHPNQIRVIPDPGNWNLRLRPDFQKILAQIPGLDYRMERGFFHWSGLGTSQTFVFNCLSNEFNRFQEDVESRQPTTFEEFEEMLS